MAAESQNSVRITIGLAFQFDYSWAGGMYYVLNLSKTLELLPESERPNLIILYDENTPKEILDQVTYPGVKFENVGYSSLIHKFQRKLTGVDVRVRKAIRKHKIDFIYPYIQYRPDFKEFQEKVGYWIYDLQHKFLEHLFPDNELRKRDKDFNDITTKGSFVFVSSNASKDDLIKFYPEPKALPLVYRFVTINKKPEEPLNRASLDLEGNYFLVLNQFWKHKNHLAVIKAAASLKKNRSDFKIVFTGNLEDQSNQGTISEVKNEIQKHGLVEHFIFPGFVSRDQLMQLVTEATAVIQPSRFEGWSTVVEDAKALNATVLASDLKVHQEQLGDQASFFDCDDIERIKQLMEEALNCALPAFSGNYESKKTEAAKAFLTIVRDQILNR